MKIVSLDLRAFAFAGAPTLAAAQSLSPMGWTDDGKAVVRVDDPMQIWTSDDHEPPLPWFAVKGLGTSYFAVCEARARGYRGWGAGCQVCVLDANADTVGPPACGLSRLKTWGKAIKGDTHKKFALKSTRTCDDGDNDGCRTTIALGKTISLRHSGANRKKKPKITIYFRKDGMAALVVVREESESDEATSLEDMVVVDLSSGDVISK